MNLEEIRKEIDKTDKELLDLLGKRTSLISKVAEYKIKKNIPVEDSERRKQIISSKRKKAEELNINPDLIEKIYTLLIDEACKIQEKIMKK